MNKLKFTNLINQELNHSIQYFDTLSVVNILIDEMQKDLLDDKQIKIGNLGTLELTPLKSKRIRNIATGQISQTKPSKALRFHLAPKLIKYLSNK